MRFPLRSSSPSQGLKLFEAGLHSKCISFNQTQRRILSVALGLFITFLIWVVPSHYGASIITQTGSFIPSFTPHYHDKLIANGTLGFQKIIAIGLADRSDRRDGLELAADVTNLQLTWMDGVTPSLMSPKTIPPAYKLPAVHPGVIGCWRSHMNVIRRIVAEKISSALIIEDDADWDVRIVEQMTQFSGATKELLSNNGQERSTAPRTKSPYGEGWDILWIGHCGGFHGNTSSVPNYIIRNDDTMPPSMAIKDMLFGPNPYSKWNPDNSGPPCAAHAGRDPPGRTCDSPRLEPKDRIVQERAKPVCTTSYAISYQGARKVLARVGGLSLVDVFAPVDQGIGDVCAGSTDLPGERTRCFTPSPPYIVGHKSRGLRNADSDIQKTGTHGEKRITGWSSGIMQPARLNANSIVSNVDFQMEDQYVRDGGGNHEWRLRLGPEYRSFVKEKVIEKWIW